MTAPIDASALGLDAPCTLFIDDAFAASASGATFATVDPSTEAVLAEVARGDAADVDRAVAAARRALRGPWRDLAPAERGRLIFRLADVVLAHREEIARVETLDVGKPLRESRGDVDGVVATLRYNAGAADKLEGATIPLGRSVIDFTLLEPVGVTAHIVPWNYPLGMLARSLAPALAAGCTAVVKPAEQSPLSALLFARCCLEAGIPPGVVNVVTGLGEEAGAALVAHPDVRGVTFTGSVETGRLVYAGAARGLKPAVLELGGKNPVIVLPDADLDRAVADVLDGAFGNSGQVCSSSSRLLLHRSIHDAFLDRLAAAAARLTVGPGLDDRDLGPVVSAEQQARVLGYVAAGLRDGARLRLGGGRPAHLERGYFVAPTILDRVQPSHVVAREEIFGPVAVALAFDTLEEATAIANGLGYGLVAGVYGRDIGTALTLARDLEAGSVWINGWFIGGQQAPTGGIKDSGVGRERGLPGIMNYLQIKNVGIRLRAPQAAPRENPRSKSGRDMGTMKDVETVEIFRHGAHCVNQIAMRTLKNGDLLAVFNEERFPFHHDSGQTLMTRSTDGGRTWSAPHVVLPWSSTEGNWDCGICELDDGTLLVNLTITGFFKRGVRPEQPSWSSHPRTEEWGDWTWTYKLQGWLGTFVLKSSDGGATWTKPIPVNVRPLKHGGCRLGSWLLPNGSLLMGLYGRIRGYEEEGEGETTRSALMRSDDGGENWEYFSTLAYDPASIIDYEEPALLRLHDGRLVCFMRTHVQPSSDARNMVMTISEDDGFSWTPPKWTNIWGYPAELIALADGRYLMVYGYRRPPYGVRGIISEDGVTWDVNNEFVIREGGVPGRTATDTPGSSRMTPESGKIAGGGVDWHHPGIYQHIGYPSVAQAADGTIVCAYHEWTDDPKPLQYVLCTRFRV